MTPETEFYLKMLGVFVASGLIWLVMLRIQKRKEREADEKYEFTMKLIEMRNKKIGDSNES